MERACAILFRADPTGIADGNPNEDEYEPEAQRILARADEAATPDALALIVADVLRAQFGRTDARLVDTKLLARHLWIVVQDLHADPSRARARYGQGRADSPED